MSAVKLATVLWCASCADFYTTTARVPLTVSHSALHKSGTATGLHAYHLGQHLLAGLQVAHHRLEVNAQLQTAHKGTVRPQRARETTV